MISPTVRSRSKTKLSALSNLRSIKNILHKEGYNFIKQTFLTRPSCKKYSQFIRPKEILSNKLFILQLNNRYNNPVENLCLIFSIILSAHTTSFYVCKNFRPKLHLLKFCDSVWDQLELYLGFTYNPLNPYGATKDAVQIMLKSLSSKHQDKSFVALRYFNPVAAHPCGQIGEMPEKPTNLFTLIEKVIMGQSQKIFIFGNDYQTKDGTGERDFIHIMDLASGHQNTGRRCANFDCQYLESKECLERVTKYSVQDSCRHSYNFIKKQMEYKKQQ